MIRTVNASDLMEILQLEYAVFRFPYPAQLVNFLYANYRDTFIVADSGGILGYLIAIFDEDEGHILPVAVKEEARNLGIGKALMTHILEHLRQEGVPSVRLEVRKSNSRAITFYKRLGFTVLEYIPEYYEDGEGAYIMTKRIW